MKLLRLHLLNLNSLRGSHSLDLSQPPLLHAGLFAIIGPTGAGKSTLLDAITLALYGRAARYAGTRSPEDVMSRHTGECRAEVEFQVPSGRYRAVWALRRAHRKPTGKVQNATRHLYDGEGHPLAESIRDVEARIETLIGLDYDRFLRSAMLAQGEFARFLKANSDERADLLESLTGRRLYSELGARAYEECVRRESALEQQFADVQRIKLLTDEERATRQTELTARAQELAAVRQAVAAGQQRLLLAEQLARGVAEAERLAATAAELATARQAAAADQARLDRHQQATPFRDDLARCTEADRRLARERHRQQQARTQLAAARTAHAVGLAAAVEVARRQVARLAREVESAQREAQIATAQAEQLALWLTEHAADLPLTTALPEIAAALKGLEEARAAHDRTLARGRRLEAAGPPLTAAVAAASAQAEQARQSLATAQTAELVAMQALHEQAARGDEAALQQRLQEGQAILQAGERLHDLMKRQHEQTDRVAVLAAEALQRQAELTPARAHLAQAAAAEQTAEEELAHRQDHLAQASLVAKYTQQRALLVKGQPCPLCGAVAHPYAEQAPDTHLQTLKRRVQQAEEAWRLARRATESARLDVTRLETALLALERQRTETAGEVAALAARSQAAAAALGLPGETDPGSLLAWLQLQAQHQARLAEQVAELRRRQDAVTHAAAARRQAEQTCQDRRHEHDRARDAWQRHTQERQQAADEARQAEAQATAAATALAPLLAPFAACVPADGATKALRQALEARRDACRQQQERRQQAHDTARAAAHRAAQREQELAPLRARAELLAQQEGQRQVGEAPPDPTAVAAQSRAWTTLAEAEAGLRELADRCTGGDSAAQVAERAVAEAEAARREAAAALTTRLADSPFPTPAELQAALLTESEAARLAQQARDWRDRQIALDTRREALTAELAHLRAAGAAEDEALAALTAEQQARTAAMELLHADIATRESELRQDDATRRDQAARLAAVEAERARLKVWQQLKALIGSADGKRFRTFAQGLSLDLLIRHANRHLARLTDRYLIRRRPGEGLELEIEDAYQAGARRPTASLSGGESFLASLALALGLADLAGRQVQIDSLFIDEGFGALDSTALETALSALEALRQDRKTVGVISHVEMLKERIATQVLVERGPGGTSRIVVPTR